MAPGAFNEPFDVEEISALIGGVSQASERFLSTVIISCGMKPTWDAVLAQLVRLLPIWEAAGEDDQLIYQLFGALGIRARQHRDREQSAMAFRAHGLDVDRVNFEAIRIIETKPFWYPRGMLPLNRRERENERRWLGLQ